MHSTSKQSLLEKIQTLYKLHNTKDSTHASIKIKKNKGYSHESILCLPASKSYTNRALIIGAMTGASVDIENILFAEDTYWALHALICLGFNLEIENSSLHIPKRTPIVENNHIKVHCGKSGTLLRFLPGLVLNLSPSCKEENPVRVDFSSDSQLAARPISELIVSLRRLGGLINETALPFTIQSSALDGETEISGKTSGQFLSGLLIAACGSKEAIKIKRIDNLVQKNYILITEHVLKSFGFELVSCPNLIDFKTIPRTENSSHYHFKIEGDWSTACYFFAIAFVFKKKLTIRKLSYKTLQADILFIDFLKKLGARFLFKENEVTLLETKTPREYTKLYFKEDMFEYSDQALTLAALSVALGFKLKVSHVEHIRRHESDRIKGLMTNLRSLSITCEEYADGFFIAPPHPSQKLEGQWKTYADHRFVMSGSILACRHENIVIREPNHVQKTCPNYFNLLEGLGFLSLSEN